MKHLQLQDLIISSVTAVATIYGYCSLLSETFYTILPFGIILSLILICVGYFLRIPPPSAETVEAIIGKDPQTVENNDVYVLKTVAHRGAGLDAPENSLVAFRLCNDKGCDGIEFDVTLTKDEVPVVFHDDTLERLTDLKLKISEQKWEDLSSIDISVKHVYQDRFAKTNIPTLEQTVTQLLTSGQRMIIDIKDHNFKFVKIVLEIFERYPDLYSRAVVSSFYPAILYLIRRQDPKIVCSMAWRPHVFAHESFNYPTGKGAQRSRNWFKHYFYTLCDILHAWALPRIIYYLIGLSIILLHKDVISGKEIMDWRKKGVRVMAWTVNTPAEKQYLARIFRITYLTDTLTGEGTTHATLL